MHTFQLSNYEVEATYIRECLDLLFKLDEVLTLISKLHTDSSIHICEIMFSIRLQSSYIRECPELGCNLLDVVLMFISNEMSYEEFNWKSSTKTDITCTRGQMK